MKRTGIMILLFLGFLTGIAFFTNQLSAKTAVPQHSPKPLSQPKSPQAANNDWYMGMSPVSPKRVQRLFPDAKGKPLLVMFHSKYCHDCKRMKPVIEALLPKHPKLAFKSFDIFDDKKKAAPVFSAFKPVSVPILVFINANGETKNVLYNYQKQAVVVSGINQVGG